MSRRKTHRGTFATSTMVSVVASSLLTPAGFAATATRVSLSDMTAWPQLPVQEFLARAGVGRVKASIAPAPAVAISNSKKMTASVEPSTLEITMTSSGLAFRPSKIEFAKSGDKLSLKIAAEVGDLALFVRDENTLEIRREVNQIAALKSGVTELYAFNHGRMYIVPVNVRGDATQKRWDMRAPDNLFGLDGIIPVKQANATYTSGRSLLADGARIAQEPDSDANEDSKSAEKSDNELLESNSDLSNVGAESNTQLKSPSLAESVAATQQAMERQSSVVQRFYHTKEDVAYQSISMQLIDDRSDLEAGKIYPVVGATVRLIGTNFVGKTDATGHLTIKDMPKKSRFLVHIDDANGVVRSSLAEVATTESGVIRLKMLRNLIFDGLSAIAGTVQKSNLGSYCGTVSDKSNGNRSAPVSGVALRLDVPAEGPYYFNRYGYLDRGMGQTGIDGRYCFFNVTPGPAALTAYRADQALLTQPLAIFFGNHIEDSVVLGNQRTLSVQLVSMATAQEQLSSDDNLANAYKSVDMVDIIPFGDDAPLMQTGPGKVEAQDPVVLSGERFRLYSRAAEFEPAVYTYQVEDSQKVLPLIPRGFVEDMSIFAQVAHDPTQGAILVHYSAPTAASKETITLRLMDQNGLEVGDGWYFSDAPMTKAIFFNVPAGTYSLQVQTKDGYWLRSDTVIVYNETTSFVQLGNPLRPRPAASRLK